jgi:predicted TIM-barrel fold metal-dependent hydrolase
MTIHDLRVIDTDTHVVEPPDLWTSRIPARYGDRVPHVRWDAATERDMWFAGDERLGAAGMPAAAGWHEHPPLHPARFAEIDPDCWDPVHRAAMMDRLGIDVQILYPNVAIFNVATLMAMDDPTLQLACIAAYNDFQVDWCDTVPGRYVAITALPFWDLDLTLAEMERCAARGHRGIAFTQNPAAFCLPKLTDRYWDPMWASAEEKQLSVNFHIASGGDVQALMESGHQDNGMHANYAAMGVSHFLSNARTIAQLVTGGICHRFPTLKFVSVESGIGWIPFALESLDWQWLNCGVHKEHPEYDLLPSEYFRRQIYGCFWFERDSARFGIDALGVDNVMFETDYPHPTSMSPGPASAAITPRAYVEQELSHLTVDQLRAVLSGNAERVYRL